MIVTKNDIMNAINLLSLNNKCICIHSSLKSFGYVNGGANTIIDTFIKQSCTILAPAFPYEFGIPPLVRVKRNGYDYDRFGKNSSGHKKIFSVNSNEISGKFMGAIPCEILKKPNRKRGYHPLNSFVAIGPMANELVKEQSEINVYSPLKKLQEKDGYIVLMGVGLNKMTAIHYAEQLAGRNLFIRWANGVNGKPIKTYVGGCSAGFNQLQQVLSNIEKRYKVGKSIWRIFPINKVIEQCADAIKKNAGITHCPDPNCIQCNDAILGGPVD